MIKSRELTDPKSCMSRAKDGEMTFVLLVRDIAAPKTIKAWVDERIRVGKNSYTDPQIAEALECMDEMERQRGGGNGNGDTATAGEEVK